jgi:hypothetical protein
MLIFQEDYLNLISFMDAQAVLWVLLSWTDPRAERAVAEATAAFEETGICDKPCRNTRRLIKGAGPEW